TDAHTGSAVAQIAQRKLGREGKHVTGAGRSEWVTDRDGPAVRIEVIVGDLEPAKLVRQLAQHSERLRSERLVDFPYVDVGGRHLGSFESGGEGPRRRDAHELG